MAQNFSIAPGVNGSRKTVRPDVRQRPPAVHTAGGRQLPLMRLLITRLANPTNHAGADLVLMPKIPARLIGGRVAKSFADDSAIVTIEPTRRRTKWFEQRT